MKKRRWLLATIADDAARLAAAHGLGIEIDEFCTAANMDENFEYWDGLVRGHGAQAPMEVFHAPFAELHPCAIDPRARRLAMDRFLQAADLAKSYGIRRMVVHGGFLPNVYYPIWYEEQSAGFWHEFLECQPDDFELLIENVLEDDPQSMLRMISGIGDARARMCLDVGHANVVSDVPLEKWIEVLGGHIRHVHLHNNHGKRDEHNPPDDGGMDIPALMERLDCCAPDATVTLECMDARDAVKWLGSVLHK